MAENQNPNQAQVSESGTISETRDNTDSCSQVSRYDETDDEARDENQCLVLTEKHLKKLLKNNQNLYYATPEVNDQLYLHFKGYKEIRNMQMFPNLKCLYFEGNGLRKVQGLETNIQLRSLFLQQNMIAEITGLETLVNLGLLNLERNLIRKITGLSGCKKLETLIVSSNRLGGSDKQTCVESLEELKECPELHTLDVRKNHLEDPALLDEVFCKIENLSVLYVNHNEFKPKIKNYRKMMVAKIVHLDHLDDRPVFEKERRLSEAFLVGEKEAEQVEREVVKQEEADKEDARRENFQQLLDQGKEEWKDREQKKIETRMQSKLTMKEMLAQAKKDKITAAENHQNQKNDQDDLDYERDGENPRWKVISKSEKQLKQAEEVEKHFKQLVQQENQEKLAKKKIAMEQARMKKMEAMMNRNNQSQRQQELLAFLDEQNVELNNPHPVATEQTQATADYYDEEEEDEEEIAPATYAELMNKGPPSQGRTDGKTAAEILIEKLEAKVQWKNKGTEESKEMKPIIEEGDLPDIAIELLTQGNKKVDSPKLKKINPLDVLD